MDKAMVKQVLPTYPQMAAVVRCSCILPPSKPGRFTMQGLPYDQIPGKIFVSGKLESLSLKVKKFISSFGSASNRPLDNIYRAMGDQFMDMKTGERSYDPGQVPPHNAIVKHLAEHQEMVLIRSTSIALIVSTALILSTPLEALAETCEGDTSVFNMPLLLFVALVGAAVGGLLARQRKGELKRLNEQLRQINAALRKQAKIESYAPTLSYAPVGTRIIENEVIVDPRKQDLIYRLKNGKTFLRNQDPEKAYLEFKTALELAQTVKDPIEEKKAARGLGASLQRQGKYKEAIKYHSMVLEISERGGEDSGNTEAYGAIADCYTELGDLERAGVYYDRYIARLQTD
ncbi:hypothetical protein LguiB_023352 [Lonicera macranthoides]